MAMLFEIPAEFLARHAAGTLVRYGAILKEVNSGRIVAHLQETGVLNATLRSPLAAIANPAAAGVTAVSSIVGNFQAYRIEKRVEELGRFVQAMQYTQLAVAGLGLGVSIAGFFAIRKQMGDVSMKLDHLTALVERRFEEQKRREMRKLEDDLEAQLDLAEEGWSGDGHARWTRVANKLNDIVYSYPGLIEEELRADAPDPALLSYLLERYRVLAATRIECLVLVGELRPAQDFAARFSQKTNALLNDVTPTGLARRIGRGMAAPGTPAQDHARTTTQARDLVTLMRELQDVSETRPLLLETLIDHGVNGRDYIEALRENRTAPVVMLK